MKLSLAEFWTIGQIKQDNLSRNHFGAFFIDRKEKIVREIVFAALLLTLLQM